MSEDYIPDNEEEKYETEEGTELDWKGWLTEGLLPVSRVHITILKGRIQEKTSQKDGSKYKQISIQYVLDRHEVLGSEYPKEGKEGNKSWLNFYLRGRTTQRFRGLYAACTGSPIKPTSTAGGVAKINMDAIVEELVGLGCYGTLLWKKQDDDSFEEQLGWNFAKTMEELTVPVNPHLKEEEEDS